MKNEKSELRKYSMDVIGNSVLDESKVNVKLLNKDIALKNQLMEQLGSSKGEYSLSPKERADSVRSFIEAVS